MNCPSCNAMNAEKSTTCWSCGTRLPSVRTSCAKVPDPKERGRHAPSAAIPKLIVFERLASAAIRVAAAVVLFEIYREIRGLRTDVRRLDEDVNLVYERIGQMRVY